VTEHLALVLKICLLVLLYLFFLRVLRAVWAEVREPVPAAADPGAVPGRAQRSPAPARAETRRRRRKALRELVFLEPAPVAGRTEPLGAEMTIGRGSGCTIVIEDHFISSVHTRVFQREDNWLVEDLGSTNGTYLNRKKVTAPTVIHRADQIQVGNAILEVR
jgi:pSer/pThr/pTyr-binding forkhead associated (FHA) protein